MPDGAFGSATSTPLGLAATCLWALTAVAAPLWIGFALPAVTSKTSVRTDARRARRARRSGWAVVGLALAAALVTCASWLSPWP